MRNHAKGYVHVPRKVDNSVLSPKEQRALDSYSEDEGFDSLVVKVSKQQLAEEKNKSKGTSSYFFDKW